MVIKFSNINVDKFGRPEVPELVLQTLSGREYGVLSGVSKLKFNIKFSEPSEISFDIPRINDGEVNELYREVIGHRVIYTKDYGVYVIKNPVEESDGIEEVKHVTGYSLEHTLENRAFFLEEGTFNFWNPVARTNTILGRILEVAKDWEVNYVSPSLIGRYRTFSQFDDYLLPFIYNKLPELYRCVFSFNPYLMEINVYDADEAREILPIYLEYGNLLESAKVEELSDELVTALRPYGADQLDIRAVNPIGSNWIYDISYFISKGDIDSALANKWQTWQQSVLNNQSLYSGLVGLQASVTAQILAAEAELTDLNAELTDLKNRQSVTIQAIAKQLKPETPLETINADIAEKNKEIENKKGEIKTLRGENGESEDSLTGYGKRIKDLVASLSITNTDNFEIEEQKVLSRYFIEQDFTDDTFVATELNTTVSGSTYPFNSGAVEFSESKITEVDFVSDLGKRMFTFKGGKFKISGDMALSGDVIRGTLEISNSGKCVMSLFAGTLKANEVSAPSGMITLTGSVSGLTNDIRDVDDQGVITKEGTLLGFTINSASLYLTANINEYQRYSVQMELFEHAAGVLSDLAIPTYEFSVDTANFLFAEEFEPFRDELELGGCVYLNLNEDTFITPVLIELELDFEKKESINLIFSNRFKRHDNVNTLKDLIDKSYSSSRSFDASKYLYNQASNQMSSVTKFMNDSLDAAVNSIMTAPEQKVVIDGAGIHVGDASGDQIRIINNMIAMTEDGWTHAKVAIGRFKGPEIGEYWGVNADVIGGKLIVGSNMVIESENGVQFRLDSSGAWLCNATLAIQGTSGGILISPDYGIAAGKNGDSGEAFFDVKTDEVTGQIHAVPRFWDESGQKIKTDDLGMPEGAEFYLDSKTGAAYFRGALSATTGDIGGWTLADNNLHSGSGTSYVGLSSSGVGGDIAIWAGSSTASSAPFKVYRNGTVSISGYATTGSLSGYATKSSLADGTTTISGGCITTGTITANHIKTNTINGTCIADLAIGSGKLADGAVTADKIAANAITADKIAAGSITVGKLADGVIPEIPTVPTHLSNLVNDMGYVEESNMTSIIGGIVTTDYIYALGIEASVIRGGYVDLMDDGGKSAGKIGLSSAESASYAIDLQSYGALRLQASSGNVYIECGGGAAVTLESDVVKAQASVIPSANGGWGLGLPGYRWDALYAVNGTIQTSDMKLKKDIEPLPDKYIAMIDAIEPKRYRMVEGTSGRYHVGFIAQEVRAAMDAAGVDSTEFGGWIAGKNSDGEDIYMLRYDEFIGILLAKIKQLESRIEAIYT